MKTQNHSFALLSLYLDTDGCKHQAHQVSAHSNQKYTFGRWRGCALYSNHPKIQGTISPKIQNHTFPLRFYLMYTQVVANMKNTKFELIPTSKHKNKERKKKMKKTAWEGGRDWEVGGCGVGVRCSQIIQKVWKKITKKTQINSHICPLFLCVIYFVAPHCICSKPYNKKSGEKITKNTNSHISLLYLANLLCNM